MKERIERLSQIYNIISTIQVAGQNAIYMGLSLTELGALIKEMIEEEEKTNG